MIKNKSYIYHTMQNTKIEEYKRVLKKYMDNLENRFLA
jgi:hypothetical protein